MDYPFLILPACVLTPTLNHDNEFWTAYSKPHAEFTLLQPASTLQSYFSFKIGSVREICNLDSSNHHIRYSIYHERVAQYNLAAKLVR